jgi:hypothetical protein
VAKQREWCERHWYEAGKDGKPAKRLAFHHGGREGNARTRQHAEQPGCEEQKGDAPPDLGARRR